MLAEDRLTLGLKALERAREDFQAGWKYYSQVLRARLPAGKPAIETDEVADGLEYAEWPPYLEEVLEQTGALSPHSAVLGVCDDGLPFLLDLTNPAPGAILIGGSAGSGKTRLLGAILASVASLSTPAQVVYHLIGDRITEFYPIDQEVHCQSVIGSQGIAVDALIEKLCMIAEARRRERPRDPAIILAIDDLAGLVDSLDDQAFARLYWLINHGPRAFIWTIAALSAEKAEHIHPRLLSVFRTRLIGHVKDRKQGRLISGDDNLDTQKLEEGYQFCVPYGEEWLPFWLCEPAPQENQEDSQELAKEETA